MEQEKEKKKELLENVTFSNYFSLILLETKIKLFNMENFDLIYNANHKSILNFIIRKVNNQEVAEELTNDVFMKVYKNLDKYDEKLSTMKTWIMNITSNTVIDYYRKRKLETISLEKDFKNDDNRVITVLDRVHSKGYTPFQEMTTNEGVENIKDAISNLPSKYEVIAELFFNEEYSYEEISKKLNIPLGTVKGQISRTRKILTAKLQRV